MMMASAQVVETSVNTNNSPSQDYTTNPDDHSNHNKYRYVMLPLVLNILTSWINVAFILQKKDSENSEFEAFSGEGKNLRTKRKK